VVAVVEADAGGGSGVVRAGQRATTPAWRGGAVRDGSRAHGERRVPLTGLTAFFMTAFGVAPSPAARRN